MKSFFSILNLSIVLLFTGCAPTSSLQPDEVLLNNSKNNIGTSPINIQEITKAPEDNAFRVQEIQHLEELIESSQISRAESREAVFIGETESPLLNGPFSSALKSGLIIQPRENIQVLWPLDIINGYIKVKNSRDSISWIKYKNDLNQAQIILLENFIIPQISIEDSRLITISQTNPPQNTAPIAVSSEESKDIPPAIEEPPAETEEIKGEASFTPEENPLISDVEFSAPSEILSEEPLLEEAPPSESTAEDTIVLDATPDSSDLEIVDANKGSSLAPLTSQRPQARPDNLLTEEGEDDSSPHAPEVSPRPQARPDNLITTPQDPPLLAAASPSTQELINSLEITEVPILNESQYLRNGQRKITEVFPRAHKNFSACTFNPAQGSTKNRCYKELVLSEEFTDFLEQKGQACAEKAAQEVFEKIPLKVLLKTNGGSLNRSNSNSLHYRGRALDVFKISLYFERGVAPREVPFHKNKVDGQSVTERQNYNFYWSFQGCWKKEIQEHHLARSCGGRGRGVLTYRYNSDHSDHMHISLPVCRDLRKRFNLNST